MYARRFITVLMISGLYAASAQTETNEKSSSADSRHGRNYDPQTTETFSGEVTQIEHVKPSEAMRGRGVHLIVKTESQSVQVDLGPDWFIENQQIQIKLDDKVTVTGSRVTAGDQPVVIAREVRKDGEVLRLRDEIGRPVWAGWRAAESAEQGTTSRRMRGRGMMGGPRGRGAAMMAEREQMFSELKSMQADLDKKLAQMNSATGPEKIDAMAAVINEMAHQRDEMVNQMEEMHKRMMARMEQMRGPAEENEPAGAARNRSDEPANEQDK